MELDPPPKLLRPHLLLLAPPLPPSPAPSHPKPRPPRSDHAHDSLKARTPSEMGVATQLTRRVQSPAPFAA